MPKISIVLPVYNGENYLEKAIISIIQQSFKDWELIIVNDCSKDGSEKIIEKYVRIDKRIRCITNDINQKLPASLNIGFENANGDYYTWTSHDNVYLENALLKMIEFLEENNRYSLVYCDYSIIDEKDVVKEINRLGNPEYLSIINVVGACFLYTREAAKRAGNYDTSMFLAEDYDYWIRLSQQGQVAHITDLLYLYRDHGESLTNTRKEQVLDMNRKIFIKYFSYYSSNIKNKQILFKFYDGLIGNKIYKKKKLENLLYLIRISIKFPSYLVWIVKKITTSRER